MNKPNYNPEMQLSENFRLKEFIESQTADERGIDNRPDWEAVINLRNLCREVLQARRGRLAAPLWRGCRPARPQHRHGAPLV